jgi:hypothetical protein
LAEFIRNKLEIEEMDRGRRIRENIENLEIMIADQPRNMVFSVGRKFDSDEFHYFRFQINANA